MNHAVVLLFARGQRPTVSDFHKLSLQQGQFAVTLDGSDAGGAGTWAELLANGLTFDLAGLAPGEPAAPVADGQVFGLAADFDPGQYDAVSLSPGPHLVSGGPMVPVLRCLAWLAAEMAVMENLCAIAWQPAGSICDPAYFRDVVGRWIGGGAFPGLGLTTLIPQADGSLQSKGLDLFTGQELLLEADPAMDQAQAGKVALRLLHWLVENGRVTETMSLTGPSGETLLLEPRPEQGIVCVWRGSR
jgi:hypothetical protein